MHASSRFVWVGWKARVFGGGKAAGNEAAVFGFENRWPPEKLMQAAAEKAGFSESAFVLEQGKKFFLRWFSPRKEVKLCGHATLAAAAAAAKKTRRSVFRFQTVSGVLTVKRNRKRFCGFFPKYPLTPFSPPDVLRKALKTNILLCVKSSLDICVLVESRKVLAAIRPDMRKLKRLNARCLLVTAPGEERFDYFLRVFAPRIGIPEDPATGSAHCLLAPFWEKRLKKTRFRAQQLSEEKGIFHVRVLPRRVAVEGRVRLTGKVTFAAEVGFPSR